jgi:tRNA G10  N-methylase Trm11
MKYIFWLGTNNALSKAELSTVLSREQLPYKLISDEPRYWIIETEEQLNSNYISRLGGIDRIGEIIGTYDKQCTSEDIFQALAPTAPKIMLGVSKHNLPNMNIKRVANDFKKECRRNDIKIKYVLAQNSPGRLNTAQVIFNKLTTEPNAEITVIKENSKFLLAKTLQVQDIQAYEKRDTSRPARDAKVGLLPPKLAQIMINLVPEMNNDTPEIYDPFCGMGTVLQEGWLLGYKTVGSDVSDRMIASSEQNLQWLKDSFELDEAIQPELHRHDIRENLPSDLVNKFDAIVTEPFLGDPMRTPISQTQAVVRQNQLRDLYLAFFRNALPALKQEGWVVIILPAPLVKVQGKSSYDLFPTKFIDEVEKLGYICNHLGKDSRGLMYARPNALVAREITLWCKK